MSHVRSPGLWPILVLLLLGPAAVAMAQDADHLLLNQVLVQTRGDVSLFGSPFIEVTNPTGEAVVLTDVFLSTAHDAQLSQLYWNVVTGANAGGGTSGNVHGRFPAGMSLAAGEALVISLNGSDEFEEAYGYLPDLEWFEDGAAPDQVPEMVEVFTGSIAAGLGSSGSNTPALSISFDSIMLYTWDGQDDLVADLDYLIYGTDQRVRVDKTGVTVGTSTYLADTAPADQISPGAVPTFGRALLRIDAVEADEVASDGNGVDGHDETSENLASSWTRDAVQDPAGPPASWYFTAPIVLDADNGNARENAPVAVQAEVVAYSGVNLVTVHYRVAGGAWIDLDAPSAGGDIYSAQIPGEPADTVVEWYLTTTSGDDIPTTWPVEGEGGARSYTVVAGIAGVSKLLITELNTGDNIYPFTGMEQIAPEFIEIHNPNAFDVDMSDYYVTDAINYYLSTQVYWAITAGNPTQGTVGGGDYNDFTARFPDGFTIAANQTIVVSLASSGWFERVYGTLPDIEMYADDLSVEGVLQMRPVFLNPGDDLPGDSIFTADRPYGSSLDLLPKGIPELEEFYGEPLILYYWSEGDPIVTDVDVFMWGDEKTGDRRIGFDKTGQPGYSDDTPVADQDWYPEEVSGDKTYTRLDAAEGNQLSRGSNGVDGRDETSEDWSVTFDRVSPTPGLFLAGFEAGTEVVLDVPPRTFLPSLGEEFPIGVVTSDNSETKLRIFDTEGRLVITLYDSRFDGEVSDIADFPTVFNWDGRDATYEKVRAGMYIVHLQAVNVSTGEKTVKTAPVVVATRLN